MTDAIERPARAVRGARVERLIHFAHVVLDHLKSEVFLVFDVETVFLFPWAVSLGKLPLFAVVEGIIFILILVAGLAYIWRKDALEWV